MRDKLSDTQIQIIKDWINNGAKDFNGNVPFAGTEKAYVCSQGDDMIYEIDLDAKVVSGIIDVNLNTSGLDQPHNIQVRDNYLYVTLISSGYFLKIDRTTKQIISMTSGLQVPGMIQISPDGSTAYVSRSSSAASIYNSIYEINTATMQLTDEIILPVTGLPHAIALTSDGSLLYVANMSRDRISIVNTSTKEVQDEILLSSGSLIEHEPMHIYLSPDNNYLYINCRTSSKMLIMDTGTKTVISQLDIKHHPMQMGISSDGNKLFVVSHHEPFITTIEKNGASWAISKEYESVAFHHLYGADLSSDGRYLFASCSNNDAEEYFIPRYVITGRDRTSLLCIYDTQTEELVKILDIGKNATGVTAN
jgi:DNA-binding beta-propeller fold protein YncE